MATYDDAMYERDGGWTTRPHVISVLEAHIDQPVHISVLEADVPKVDSGVRARVAHMADPDRKEHFCGVVDAGLGEWMLLSAYMQNEALNGECRCREWIDAMAITAVLLPYRRSIDAAFDDRENFPAEFRRELLRPPSLMRCWICGQDILPPHERHMELDHVDGDRTNASADNCAPAHAGCNKLKRQGTVDFARERLREEGHPVDAPMGDDVREESKKRLNAMLEKQTRSR